MKRSLDHRIDIHPLTSITKMIFIGCLLISGIFFLFAHFAGGMQYFFNPDSMAVSLLVVVLFSLFTFRWRVFCKGVRCMFLFRVRDLEKDANVARHYFSLMFVAIAAGVCSTFQGMISGILFGATLPETEKFPLEIIASYTSFSTVYAMMLAFFLFYPVYLLNHAELPSQEI